MAVPLRMVAVEVPLRARSCRSRKVPAVPLLISITPAALRANAVSAEPSGVVAHQPSSLFPPNRNPPPPELLEKNGSMLLPSRTARPPLSNDKPKRGPPAAPVLLTKKPGFPLFPGIAGNGPTGIVPTFVSAIIVAPPTCKSPSRESALLAVSVMLSLIALGLPLVFHVPARSRRLCVLAPVRL